MGTNKSSALDYEVGWGKPPKSTRFQPGRSGNPGGRRKNSKNVKTLVTLVLDSEIELVENGRKRKVSLIEAILKRQAQEALRGNQRAISDLLDRYERHCPAVQEEVAELPDEDQALLDRLFDRRSPTDEPGPSNEANGDE